MRITSTRHTRWVRPIAIGTWILFVAGLLEGMSFLGWYSLEREAFSHAAAAKKREALIVAAPAQENPVQLSPVALWEQETRFRGQVIHPFIGYVTSPELNQITQRKNSPLVVGDDGFFHRRRYANPPDSGAVTIGIFGGSVALGFSFHGEQILREQIGEAVGQEVVIQSRAHAGYKQPQQLMTLLWFITLDQAPDVVINLDGFNDIVLPVSDNLPKGTHPFFPRGWEDRVTQVPDTRRQALIGKAAFYEAERENLAMQVSESPLRWSVTYNLLWSWRDRRLQRLAFEARRELDGLQEGTKTYLAHGPPFEPQDPGAVLRTSAEYWQRTSLLMHQLSTSAGIRYYHFLQPNQYVPNSKPLSAKERRIAVDPGSPYSEPAEQGYQLLRSGGSQLRSAGVRFSDLTDVFEGIEEPLYVDSCCHFNELGNEILARKVAEIISADLRAHPLRHPVDLRETTPEHLLEENQR